MSKKKPTINDIAQLAGVSKTTVSFAFNNPDRVAKETLRKVLEICKDLGYTPDPVARTLTTKRTGSIGFLLPEVTPEGFKNPLLFQFLQGMRNRCLHEQLSLNIISPPPGKLLETVQRSAVDGFVILGMVHDMEFFDYLMKRNIPTVSLDGGIVENIPMVSSNEEEGAYSIMKYVLANHHRRIALLTFNDAEENHRGYSSSVGDRRLQGFDRALKEYGLSLKSDEIKIHSCSECSIEGGFSAMSELISDDYSPSAVVSMSDIISMGVYQYCRQEGLSIPHDLSVTGYDGLLEVALLDPPLTTIQQPAVQKGEEAIAILTEILKGQGGRSKEFPLRFLEGQSVASIS